jgi:hypothetical protein
MAIVSGSVCTVSAKFRSIRNRGTTATSALACHTTRSIGRKGSRGKAAGNGLALSLQRRSGLRFSACETWLKPSGCFAILNVNLRLERSTMSATRRLAAIMAADVAGYSRLMVHDHVRDRLPFALEDLGEQQVKNIARRVRVYRVRPTLTHPAANAPGSPLSPNAAQCGRGGRAPEAGGG